MAKRDTQPAMSYPTSEQYDQWTEDAERMGMSVSEWMQSMIEAGRKKFDAQVDPDEDLNELRQHRNELHDELRSARRRIERLEDQRYAGEHAAIIEYVEENPGATYGEIIQHLIDTTPKRATEALDELEGERIFADNDKHYPIQGGE